MDPAASLTQKLREMLLNDNDQNFLWQRMLHLSKQRPKLTPTQVYSLATYDWLMLWGLRPRSIRRYVIEQINFIDERNRRRNLNMRFIRKSDLYRKKKFDLDLDARHINLCKKYFEIDPDLNLESLGSALYHLEVQDCMMLVHAEGSCDQESGGKVLKDAQDCMLLVHAEGSGDQESGKKDIQTMSAVRSSEAQDCMLLINAEGSCDQESETKDLKTMPAVRSSEAQDCMLLVHAEGSCDQESGEKDIKIMPTVRSCDQESEKKVIKTMPAVRSLEAQDCILLIHAEESCDQESEKKQIKTLPVVRPSSEMAPTEGFRSSVQRSVSMGMVSEIVSSSEPRRSDFSGYYIKSSIRSFTRGCLNGFAQLGRILFSVESPMSLIL